MNIENSEFYLFSGEFCSDGLPAKCRFIKKLKAINASPGREAVLIEVISDLKGYPLKYLVIVPRMKTESLFDLPNNKPVFVFVLNGERYLDIDEIDLEPDEPVIIDNGAGITSSYNCAKLWQVKNGKRGQT